VIKKSTTTKPNSVGTNCLFVFSTTIELNVKDDYTFKATGSRVIFPGFSAVYEDVKKEDAPQLPALKKNDAAHTVEVLPEQHFTQPPPRYSEASLIKT
ncbi:DNA topoisomerase, partial [human gut metagenome]